MYGRMFRKDVISNRLDEPDRFDRFNRFDGSDRYDGYDRSDKYNKLNKYSNKIYELNTINYYLSLWLCIIFIITIIFLILYGIIYLDYDDKMCYNIINIGKNDDLIYGTSLYNFVN